MKSEQKFGLGDLVQNSIGHVLMVTDILKDCGKYVYECNDGNLYNECDLYNN